jgi:hypothetical protein
MYNMNDDDLTEAVADTEQEIYSSATGGMNDPEDVESWDNIVEANSQMHDWNDNSVSDVRLSREASGDVAPGMAMAGPDENEIAAVFEQGRQAGAQELYQQVAPHLPRREPADLFSDPDRWRAELLAEARGGGAMPSPLGYSQTPANQSVDMFADPQGFRNQVLNDVRINKAIDQWNQDRVNSSMGHAHLRYGPEFEQAFTDLTRGLDPSRPDHQSIIRDVVNAPDPGAALMNAAAITHAANASAARYGGPPFAPGLMRQREPLRNSEGLPPRSREEAEEIDVFRDALDDTIWGGF